MSEIHGRSVMRSPLARVKGLGAGGSGTAHFIAQRSSAAALVLLLCALAAAGISGALHGGHREALDWVAHPLNAVLLIMTVAAACWHMALGVQTVIEDYVSSHLLRYGLFFVKNLCALAMLTVALHSLLRVAAIG